MGYQVNDYVFLHEADSLLAKKEFETVKELADKLQNADTVTMVKVYKKAVLSASFKTPVGYSFLQYLLQCIRETDPNIELPPIPISGICAPSDRYDVRNVKNRINNQQNNNKKRTLSFSIVLNVILIALVGAMFYVAVSGNNINILNYKQKLTDEYANWEQELTNREKALNEKERELNEQNKSVTDYIEE